MEVSEIEVMNFYDTHIENEVIAQKILINPFFAGQHIWPQLCLAEIIISLSNTFGCKVVECGINYWCVEHKLCMYSNERLGYSGIRYLENI